MRIAIVLAAGQGTRMRSDLPKVLHRLAGRSLLEWVLGSVEPVVDRILVIVGHRRDLVEAAVRERGVRTVVQEPQAGTGHAVACAAADLAGDETLLVLAGDVPLLRTETLRALLAEHARCGAAASVLTFRAAEPDGYGRIVRAEDGSVEAIVEHVQADAEQRRIDEVNAGTRVLDASRVLPLLDRLPRRSGGEQYLTDIVTLLRDAGTVVAAWTCSEAEALGINTPEQLQRAEVSIAERLEGRSPAP